jgi:hypothetical protein
VNARALRPEPRRPDEGGPHLSAPRPCASCSTVGRAVAERITGEVLELARVRDRLLTVLSSKTAEEITSYEGKEDLRAELARAVAPLFGEAKVLEIYFTEFLVQ